MKLRRLLQYTMASILALGTINGFAETKRLCFATSGNGYNWASTITWIGETVRQNAEAMNSEDFLDLNCMAGASSGSGVMGVVAALRHNKKLFPAGSADKPLKKPDALKFADAMIYMAFATDMSGKEISSYTTQDGVGEQGLEWWNGHYRIGKILLDFGSRVLIASNIGNNNLAKLNKYNSLEKYYSVEELSDYFDSPRISRLTDISARLEWRQLNRAAKAIRSDSQKVLLSHYQKSGIKQMPRSADIDQFIANANHPVRKALSQPLPKGIFIFTYADFDLATSPISYSRTKLEAPNYNDLHAIMTGSQKGIEQFIESDLYQETVIKKQLNVEILPTVTDDILSSMSISLLEPGLAKPVVRNLHKRVNENLDISMASGQSLFYDPQIDLAKHGRYQFKLMKGYRTYEWNGKKGRPMVGIVGGWVDGKFAAQALGYFSTNGKKIPTNFYVLTRRSSISEFAKKQIKKYFSKGNDSVAIKHFETNSDRWYSVQNQIRQKANKPYKFEHLMLNWDIPHYPEDKSLIKQTLLIIDGLTPLIGFMHRPAAIKQQSYYQVSHTINAIRVKRNQVESKGLLFDRAFNDTPGTYNR